MLDQKIYQIPLSGMKEAVYAFDFRVTGSFFEGFEYSIVNECDLFVSIEVEKIRSFFRVELGVKGNVTTDCDRCLELFKLDIDRVFPIIIKLESERKSEADDNIDLMFIPDDATSIDGATLIYEYVNLSIPMRKTHSQNEEGEYLCPPGISKYITEEDYDEDKGDPRWDALKDINLD